MKILGYTLEQTCGACPEQYEVFNEAGRQVGYLRLRHGEFTADHPDHTGYTVLTAWPKGDGIFEYDERMGYLTHAVMELQSFETRNH